VLLKEVEHSPVALIDDLAGTPHGLGVVELHLAGGDPELDRLAHRGSDAGRLEQGFGRDTAAMSAGAPDLVLLNDADLHPQLRRPDRGDVTAGAAAKKDHVEGVAIRLLRHSASGCCHLSAISRQLDVK
jgi:hypothetical protein